MGGYIVFFLLTFTSIIGMITLLKMLYKTLFEKKLLNQPFSLILTGENSCEVEYLVRSALVSTEGCVVVVNHGLDENGEEILYRLKKQNERIVIV